MNEVEILARLSLQGKERAEMLKKIHHVYCFGRQSYSGEFKTGPGR